MNFKINGGKITHKVNDITEEVLSATMNFCGKDNCILINEKGTKYFLTVCTYKKKSLIKIIKFYLRMLKIISEKN